MRFMGNVPSQSQTTRRSKRLVHELSAASSVLPSRASPPSKVKCSCMMGKASFRGVLAGLVDSTEDPVTNRKRTMKSLLIMAAFVVAFLGSGMAFAKSQEPESLYRRGQAAFHRKDYKTALVALDTYISRTTKKDPKRFDVIQQLARIYLQVHHDPDRAIGFLSKIRREPGLSDEQEDDLDGWLATARDWKKRGRLPPSVKSADELFALAERYYRVGVADTDHITDKTGAAARAVAAAYLVPFVAHFESDRRIQRALIMLGDIRRRTWTEEDFWTENFYLKEAIRRFPHTPGAQKAYAMLEEDVHVRWSGSSGDHTPKGLLQMLARYHGLARPNPTAEPKN